MPFTIRVSTPGNNALTDTNIDHYSVYADSDNVLIKEFIRGTISVAGTSIGSVAHNLGYIPFYACFQDDGTLDSWCFGAGVVEPYEVSSDTTNIYLTNKFSDAKVFKYYIFHDEVKT